MLPATRTSPGVVSGLFLALLLLLHGGSAVGDRAGEAGEGEATGEEREEQGSLGDRSAQIIRQQDAEEGRGNREDTAWSLNTDAFYSEPEVAEPKADTVNIVQDPSLLPDADKDTLCPKPTAPANGYITGHNYDDGGVVHIHCLAGYTLSGPSNLTCIPVPHPDAPGIWLPQDEYKCLPAKPSKTLCSKPEPPENGYITGGDYDYEGVVHVHCEEGYVLSGPSNITCLPVPFPGAPGVWVPQDEYRCLPADDGTIEIHTLGDDDGGAGPRYTVIGGGTNNYIIGQEDTESETLAETEDISCGKPAAPEHGQVEGSDHSMGATIHYVCDDGYTLFGPDHAACLPVPDPFHHVAIWEPPNVPTCKENPPSTLPLMLLQEASMSRVYQPSSHRRTDSQPNADQVEGLPSECSLPVVAGPCRAAIQRYYFDTSLLECLPFRYGGCKGNDNNFETYDACQKTCR